MDYPKLPYTHAKRLADRLVELLAPHCERIDIAGSIRRQCAEIGDIEIVAQPKLEEVPHTLLETRWLPNAAFALTLRHFTILKGKVFGRNCQYLIPTKKEPTAKDHIVLDLFMPEPYDYYRMLAIRTGNKEFAFRALSSNWTKLGWVGTDEGLRRKKECAQIGDHKWKCIEKKPTMPPVWKSEEEFFDWLEIDWVAPENRNYEIKNVIDLLYNPQKNKRHAS
jgi:DNA polymerase/3'-5' exonuclease PolX